MSLSDSPTLPSEVADSTMDSLLKLSFERPSSPDYDYYSFPLSPEHQSSINERVPSPDSWSDRSLSPQFSSMSSQSTPRGDLGSPPRSPPASPMSYMDSPQRGEDSFDMSPISSRASTPPGIVSPLDPASEDDDSSPLLTPVGHSPIPSSSSFFTPFSSPVLPIDLSVSGGQHRRGPLYPLSPKLERDWDSSPSLTDSPPPLPPDSPSPSEATPSREPRDTPTRESRDTPTREPRDTPTRESRDTPTRESRETPTRESRDTPTREPRDTPTREPRETPTREPRETPTREPRDTPTREPRETPTRELVATPPRRRIRKRHRQAHSDPVPLASLPGPDEVILEDGEGEAAGGGPPCVVDLTNEEEEVEDDEVEIVSADQPVVFLGSEATTGRRNFDRLHKRRRRHNSRPSSVGDEPIVINDTIAVESPTPIDLSDSPTVTGRSVAAIDETLPVAETSSNRNAITPPVLPLPPPQLFGDLIQRPVYPLDRSTATTASSSVTGAAAASAPSRVACDCLSLTKFGNSSHYYCNHELVAPPAHGGDSSYSSRSGVALPRMAAKRSIVEAPIPQDVLEDIASLCAERHPPNPLSRLLIAAKRLPLTLPLRVDVPPHPSLATPAHSAPLPAQPAPRPSQTRPSLANPASSTAEDSGGLSCPICFESFEDIKREGKAVSSTVCGHIFCTLCLQASLRQAKLCPTCRKRLSKKQYHPLYI